MTNRCLQGPCSRKALDGITAYEGQFQGVAIAVAIGIASVTFAVAIGVASTVAFQRCNFSGVAIAVVGVASVVAGVAVVGLDNCSAL